DKNVITDMNRETFRLYEKMEGLEMQKAQLDIKQNYYKYVNDYIRKGENLDQVILPSSIGVEDGVLTSLITQMINMQMEYKLATGHDKLENPIILRRLQRIDEIKGNILESINQQEATDKIQSNFYAQQIAQLEQQLSYLPVAERQFVSIQRRYSLLENLYVF